MFWNDPILYGATLPFKDIKTPFVPTPFMGMTPPWQLPFFPQNFGFTPFDFFGKTPFEFFGKTPYDFYGKMPFDFFGKLPFTPQVPFTPQIPFSPFVQNFQTPFVPFEQKFPFDVKFPFYGFQKPFIF